MMILFGGGDGGGIYVGPDGKIHRIPPWNPEVLLQLRAVSALVSVGTLSDSGLTHEVGALAERLSERVIPQVTKIAGVTHLGDSSIAFFDADGGFVCGSTGKRPIPVPRHVTGNLFSPVTSQEPIHV